MENTKSTCWLTQAFKDSKIRNLKDSFDKCISIDNFVEKEMQESIAHIPNDLRIAHTAVLSNLNNMFDGKDYETKFKDYEYFEKVLFEIKSNFKATYKFEVIQEETDEQYQEIKIDISTSLKNYSVILTLNGHKEDRNSNCDDCDYAQEWVKKQENIFYLYNQEKKSDISKFVVFSESRIFNFENMINQILSNTKKENKEYKLNFKANKKYFLSSKKTVEELEDEKIESLIQELKDNYIAIDNSYSSIAKVVTKDLKVRSLNSNQIKILKIVCDKGLCPIEIITKRNGLTDFIRSKREEKKDFIAYTDNMLTYRIAENKETINSWNNDLNFMITNTPDKIIGISELKKSIFRKEQQILSLLKEVNYRKTLRIKENQETIIITDIKEKENFINKCKKLNMPFIKVKIKKGLNHPRFEGQDLYLNLDNAKGRKEFFSIPFSGFINMHWKQIAFYNTSAMKYILHCIDIYDELIDEVSRNEAIALLDDMKKVA